MKVKNYKIFVNKSTNIGKVKPQLKNLNCFLLYEMPIEIDLLLEFYNYDAKKINNN